MDPNAALSVLRDQMDESSRWDGTDQHIGRGNGRPVMADNAMTSLMQAVLRENGFKIGKPRKDGSLTIKREVLSLSTFATYVVVVEVPADGMPSVVVSRKSDGGEVARKTDVAAEIAAEAVYIAHVIAR